MKKLILTSLAALLLAGCADDASITGMDGHRYRLVKPAVKLDDGSELIAEYEREGEPGARFAMHLTPEGVTPSFWRIP